MTARNLPWLALTTALALALGFVPPAGACPAFLPVGTVSVGAGPREVAVDPIRGRVYVANSGAGTMPVIDAQALAVLAEWPLNGPIRAMSIDPTTSRLYLAHAVDTDSELTEGGETELWAVDADTGRYLQGYWFGCKGMAIAANPRLQRVYVTNEDVGTVTVVQSIRDVESCQPAASVAP